MASAMRSTGGPMQACFRHLETGAVVSTGPLHDVTLLPGGTEADLAAWEAGFADAEGRFLTREEAARRVGVRGHLEAEAYRAGAPDPTLEAGRLEAWRKPGSWRAA